MGAGSSSQEDLRGDDYFGGSQRKRRRRESESSDFPSPASLLAAQREYAGDEQDEAFLDENGIPIPFPPPTKKVEMFNPKEYKDIDEHARKAPLSLAEAGYEELVEYLVEPAEDEMAKLRACYVWLATLNVNKINDYLGDRMPDNDTPLYAVVGMVTTKKYGWCWDIFTKLCRLAGIPCQKVDCKIKGSSYETGRPVESVNGYSCLVYVDGSCRVIDPVWGCTTGIVRSDQNKDWHLISEGGDGEDVIADEFFELDEYWFCTDPQELVYTHLNVEPITQLLARPVTETEFDEMAYLTKGFFEIGMTDVSQPRCVVDCGSGDAVLEFSMNEPKKLGFGYVLYKSLKDDKMNEFDGKKLKQFVFMHIVKGKLQIRVELPWIGKYKLRLIGKNYETGKAQKLCEYILLCTTPKFNAKAHPENERDEWGAGAETARLGMEPIGVDGGVVVMEEGEGEIKFKVKNPGQIRFIHQLDSEDYEAGELRDYVRQYKTEEEVVFVTKLPEHGKYNFKLHAKEDGETEYKNVLTYLVTSDVGATDVTPFPPALEPITNKIGDVAPAPCDTALQPVSHKKPVITAPKTGEMEIVMKQTGDLSIPIMQQLEHNSVMPDSVNNYVSQEKHKDKLTFKLVFPKAGTYSLNMLADMNGKVQGLYQYVIKVDYPKPGAKPFPEASGEYVPGVKLIEPKSGVLPADKKVKFKVQVPNAQGVSVEDTALSPYKQSIWEGEVVTGEGGRNIHLTAVTDSQPNGVKLYSFQVLDKEAMSALEADSAAAVLEAEQRRKALKNRAKEEKAAAIERAEDERIQNKELAEEFEEHREYFEAEERQTQAQIDEMEGKKKAGLAIGLTSLEEDMDNEELVSGINTARKQGEDGDRNKKEGKDSKGKNGKGSKGKERERSGNTEKEKKEARLAEIDKERRARRAEKARLLEEEKARKKKERADRIHRAMTMIEEGVNEKNLSKLDPGLSEAEKLRLRGPMVERAKTIYIQEKERKNIKDAMVRKDLDGIYMALETIEAKELTQPLNKEVQEAHHLAVGLVKLHRLRRMILDMDRWTIAEIRSYSRPPPIVHTVLQAALLLLGEDERTTSEWTNIQALLNTIGPMGLYARVLRFDTDNLNPEITARARDIINTTSLPAVRSEGSVGAATFFAWTNGALAETARGRPPDEAPSKPALWKRQREILGKLSWKQGGKRMTNEPVSRNPLHSHRQEGTPRISWKDVTPRNHRTGWGSSLPSVPHNNPMIAPHSIVRSIIDRKLMEKRARESKGQSNRNNKVQPGNRSQSSNYEPQSSYRSITEQESRYMNGVRPNSRRFHKKKEHRRLNSPLRQPRQEVVRENSPAGDPRAGENRASSPGKGPRMEESMALVPVMKPKKGAKLPPNVTVLKKQSPTDNGFGILPKTNGWVNGKGTKGKYPHTHQTRARAPAVSHKALVPRYPPHHQPYRSQTMKQREKEIRSVFKPAGKIKHNWNWTPLPSKNFRNSHLNKRKDRNKQNHAHGKQVARHHPQGEVRNRLPPIIDSEKLFIKTYSEGMQEIRVKRTERMVTRTTTVTRTEQILSKEVVAQKRTQHGNAHQNARHRSPGRADKKTQSAPSDSPRNKRKIEAMKERERSRSARAQRKVSQGSKK